MDDLNSIRRRKEDTPDKTRSRLNFAPLSTLLAETSDEPDWIVHGYVATDVVTALAAPPKAGKTSLLLGMLRAISWGETFAGLRTRSTRAVLLSEEGVTTLKERAQEFCVDETRVDCLVWHTARRTAWPAVVEEAIGHCKANEAELLVVDTWGRWAGLRGDEENQAGSVLDAIDPLRAAAAEGLGVVVVHHQRKTPGEYGSALRGSSALAASVDIIVELERVPGSRSDDSRRLLRSVSRFSATPSELVVVRGGGRYAALGDLDAVGAEGQLRKITRVLAEVGGGDAKTIAERTDLPRATVHDRLRELCTDGRVLRLGRGVKNDPYVFCLAPFDSSKTSPVSRQNEWDPGHPERQAEADGQD